MDSDTEEEEEDSAEDDDESGEHSCLKSITLARLG